MKKAFAALAVVIGIMSAATVSAAGITKEEAQKKALEAVSLKEDQVVFVPVEEDFDDGRQIFEVDFLVPGEMKYGFDIDAATGAVVEQDIDLWEAEDDVEYAALISAAGMQTDSAAVSVEAVDGEITDLQARMIALVDAGLKADEVTYTKCEKDLDDGIMKYEVQMRTPDGMEYEYDINAADGTILEKDIDRD